MRATALPYYEVRELLEQNAVCNDCEELTMPCYEHLLEDYFGFERHDCYYEYTVQEIADMYADDIVIIRINSHLTVAEYGTAIDIFDCTTEMVDCYWVVGRR